MSDNEMLTHHAMLVAWGQFANCINLVSGMDAVPLHQKTVDYSPNTKVLEFLVAILSGEKYLKDISYAAHPLNQDQAVAQAWERTGWADHSGVSRALSALTMEEAQQIVQVLQKVSQPFIDQEVMLALRDQGKIIYDGDLTGRPVSNTSTTYPNVAYGHMSDTIRLGYQAVMVSFHSPTYGRQWLSAVPHPGNTVACTQAESMVQAAECSTGVRPLRRTDLLRQHLKKRQMKLGGHKKRVKQAQENLAQVQSALQETGQQIQDWQNQVRTYEIEYQKRQRPERPYSRLAQARKKVGVYQRRQTRQEKRLSKAQSYVVREQAHLTKCLAQQQVLEQRLRQFEHDNAANPSPVRADFRLDAGFGTPANVALLIEMGYEVYTKPHGQWLKNIRQQRVSDETYWTRVGNNAEMVGWSALAVKDFPYPLDIAVEQFYTGKTRRFGLLIHYGQDNVTADLALWFQCYNQRQTIEAGIKEGKGVFQMHHFTSVYPPDLTKTRK